MIQENLKRINKYCPYGKVKVIGAGNHKELIIDLDGGGDVSLISYVTSDRDMWMFTLGMLTSIERFETKDFRI